MDRTTLASSVACQQSLLYLHIMSGALTTIGSLHLAWTWHHRFPPLGCSGNAETGSTCKDSTATCCVPPSTEPSCMFTVNREVGHWLRCLSYMKWVYESVWFNSLAFLISVNKGDLFHSCETSLQWSEEHFLSLSWINSFAVKAVTNNKVPSTPPKKFSEILNWLWNF